VGTRATLTHQRRSIIQAYQAAISAGSKPHETRSRTPAGGAGSNNGSRDQQRQGLGLRQRLRPDLTSFHFRRALVDHAATGRSRRTAAGARRSRTRRANLAPPRRDRTPRSTASWLALPAHPALPQNMIRALIYLQFVEKRRPNSLVRSGPWLLSFVVNLTFARPRPGGNLGDDANSQHDRC